MHKKLKKDIDLLIESSWEVCNKIGGIYTVLSTKAAVLNEQFGKKLIFIGPDFRTESNSNKDFKESKTLFKSACKLELPFDIKIRCGRWNIPGSPQVILVDFKGVFPHLNEIYGKMWEEFGVDSLHAYGDYDESCAFAVACAIVTKAISQHLRAVPSKTVAHFDEWTTGMGLLYLRSIMPEAALLFTTHATTIGRSICGNGKPLYEYFTAYNGDQMAVELNVESKHSLEKIAAKQADCFTTVSEVTGRECTQLLEVTPDVITPNGFEPSFVPDCVRYDQLRNAGRKRILEMTEALTGEKFGENTFIVATSGRNEYRNKGLDLFIDSLYRFGEKTADSSRKAIAIILVPAWVKEPNGVLLKNLDFNGNDKVEPSYMTHRLNNEDSDAICHRLQDRVGQFASCVHTPNVTFIYVPCYLDGHDGIINIGYYDLLPSLDITVFGSYYEPWGYTPMESIAFGVPTITTDKAGFGQWISQNFTSSLKKTGVIVVSRTDSNYDTDVEEISDALVQYMNENEGVVKSARKAAVKTSEKAEWKYFISSYDEAFRIALDNAAMRQRDN